MRVFKLEVFEQRHGSGCSCLQCETGHFYIQQQNTCIAYESSHYSFLSVEKMTDSVLLAERRNMLTRDNPSSIRGQGLGSMTLYCSEIIETVKVFWGSK